MAKVFLSHSSFDKEYVEQIANKFGKDKAVFELFIQNITFFQPSISSIRD